MSKFIQLPQMYIQENNSRGFEKQDAGILEIEPSNILYIEEFREINRNFCCYSVDPKTGEKKFTERGTEGNDSENPRLFKYSIVHTITGSKIYSSMEPYNIRKLIDKFYEDQEKDNRDKITITKADLVKNFIFKNLGG